jgi:hypothetical protein
MIATTISSSISEKPFCFRISIFPRLDLNFILVTDDAVDMMFALGVPIPVVTFVPPIPPATALFSANQQTFDSGAGLPRLIFGKMRRQD